MATDIIITATFDVDPKEIDDLISTRRCRTQTLSPGLCLSGWGQGGKRDSGRFS